jgi:hypothetical protein
VTQCVFCEGTDEGRCWEDTRESQWPRIDIKVNMLVFTLCECHCFMGQVCVIKKTPI